MKKVLFSLAIAAACTLTFSSCAVVGTQTGVGTLYTGTTDPVAVTNNNVGSKVGVASATNILGILVMGDAGVNYAAKNAGIKKISHVDVQKTSVLGLFGSTKTYVYGE